MKDEDSEDDGDVACPSARAPADVTNAKDPWATFEKAKTLLADRLEDDINPKPKLRRKKKGDS